MLQILAIVAGFAALAAIGLLIAIRVNGAAVLDTVDRVAGSSGEATLVAATSYGSHPQQKLRFYAAPGARNLPLLVFVHGGSWRWGDPDDYGFIARALADKGFLVVLAGYRLEDEGRYPAMLEDTAAAVAEALRRAEDFGGDRSRVVLSGHSAGAYNTVQVALEPKWFTEAGVPASSIKGVVGLAGPYDFFPFDCDSTRASFGSVGAGAESQPINHVRADAPPMLLVHGEQDTLVKPRNTRALAKALEEAGAPIETVFYPEMDHNAPLISLANPWRNRRDVATRFAEFARRVTEVSFPVQAERP